MLLSSSVTNDSEKQTFFPKTEKKGCSPCVKLVMEVVAAIFFGLAIGTGCFFAVGAPGIAIGIGAAVVIGLLMCCQKVSCQAKKVAASPTISLLKPHTERDERRLSYDSQNAVMELPPTKMPLLNLSEVNPPSPQKHNSPITQVQSLPSIDLLEKKPDASIVPEPEASPSVSIVPEPQASPSNMSLQSDHLSGDGEESPPIETEFARKIREKAEEMSKHAKQKKTEPPVLLKINSSLETKEERLQRKLKERETKVAEADMDDDVVSDSEVCSDED